MKSFTIDYKVNKLSIQQFAIQKKRVNTTVLAQLEEMYEGAKSYEFLNGLLGAYANAYTLTQNMNPGSAQEQTLGAIVAFLSDKIVNHSDFANSK